MNKNLVESNLEIKFSEYTLSTKNDFETATKQCGRHFLMQAPEKVNIEN